MEVLTGVLAIVALVLAVSGVLKVTDPSATRTLLTALGLPRVPGAVPALGAVEVVVGVAVLSVGGRAAAAATASLFLLFAGLSELARRRAPGVSCGCFGRYSSPPTLVHVAVDLGAAAVAIAAATLGPPPLGDVVADQPLAGVPFLALVLVGAGLVMVITTVLADTLHAARRLPAAARPVRDLSLRLPAPGEA
jgi:hypothetical protein